MMNRSMNSVDTMEEVEVDPEVDLTATPEAETDFLPEEEIETDSTTAMATATARTDAKWTLIVMFVANTGMAPGTVH